MGVRLGIEFVKYKIAMPEIAILKVTTYEVAIAAVCRSH
jgi:hypothetical protein